MHMPPASHRPWPIPRRRPAMVMVWHDLLFAHWRVDAAALNALLPSPLRTDTFEGHAYIAAVPFRMTGVRPWGTPALPSVSAFPELNVRAYVTLNNKPGVYFFSLDATNRLAVRVARRLFNLPYMDALMRCERRPSHNANSKADGDNNHEDWIDYTSRRIHAGAPPATFTAQYRPAGDPFRAAPDSLESFLTDRYCMYMIDAHARVLRGEIHHDPWPLQPAEAHITTNTMLHAAGLPIDRPPDHLLFARRLEVPAWMPEVACMA